MAPKNTVEEFKKMIAPALKSDGEQRKLNGFIKKRMTDQQTLLDCLWTFVITFNPEREGLPKDQKYRGLAILYSLFVRAIELAGPLNELVDFVLYIGALAIESRTGKKSPRQFKLPPNEAPQQYEVYRSRWSHLPENEQRELSKKAGDKRQSFRDVQTLASVVLNAYLKQNPGKKPTLEELFDYDPAPNTPRKALDQAMAACVAAWELFHPYWKSQSPATEPNLKQLDQAFEELRRVLMKAGTEQPAFYQLWKWIRDGRSKTEVRGRYGDYWTGTVLSSNIWREMYLEACHCAVRLARGKWGMFQIQNARELAPADRDFLLKPVDPADRDHFGTRLELGINNAEAFENLNRLRRRMYCFGRAGNMTHLDEFETVELMNRIDRIRKSKPEEIEKVVVQASSTWVAFRDKHRIGQEILDSFTIVWADQGPAGQRVIVEFHKFECQLFATTNDGLGYLVRNAVWQKMQELGDQVIAFLLAYLEVIGLVVDVVSAGSAGGFRRVAFQFIKEKMIDKATDEVLDAFHVDNQAVRTLAGMAPNLRPRVKPKGDFADASVVGRRSTDSTGLAGNPAADANKGLDLSRPKDHERSLAPPPKADAPVVAGSTTQTPIVRFDKPATNDNVVAKKAAPDEKVDDLAAHKAKIEEQKRLEAEKLAENLRQKQDLLLMGERKVINSPDAGVVQMVRKGDGKSGGDNAIKGRAVPDNDGKAAGTRSRNTGDGAKRPQSDTSVNDAARGKPAPTPKNKAEADPGYPAALEYRKNLIKRYPNLAQADLRPVYRNRGEPGLWEESVYTGSGRLSWAASLRTSRKVIVRQGKWRHLHVRNEVQLDDIDRHGFVVDTKMRDLADGREIRPPETPDVVSQIKKNTPRSHPYDPFPDSEREKLLAQLQFAKENNLPGVRWETNSPQLVNEVKTWAKKTLTDQEARMVRVELVER